MDSSREQPKDQHLLSLIKDKVLEVRGKPLSSWIDLLAFAQDTQRWNAWAFRGHADWDWDLESTLERATKDLAVEDIKKRELGMIRRFKREYRQYSPAVPAEDDHMQWMSIMRHHGAPSRLLDITYSIYVGIYFAVINAKSNKDAALWCFNLDWLNEAYDNIAPDGYKERYREDKRGIFTELYKVVLNDRDPKVYLVNPYEMPARLTRQNGGLLVPTDISASFYKNLSTMMRCSEPRPWIIKQKLSFPADELKEVLRNLRKMNITAATLFPGIDGFASSLRMLMTIPEETHTYTDQFT